MSSEGNLHEDVESEDGGVPIHESDSEEIEVGSHQSASHASTAPSTTSEPEADSGGPSGFAMPGAEMSNFPDQVIASTHPSLSLGFEPTSENPNAEDYPMDGPALEPLWSNSEIVQGTIPLLTDDEVTNDTEANFLDDDDFNAAAFGLESVLPASASIFSAAEGNQEQMELPPADALPPAYPLFPPQYRMCPQNLCACSLADDPFIENWDVEKFFRFWRQFWLDHKSAYPPISDLASSPSKFQRPEIISASDGLKGIDPQGIAWDRLQTTRENARFVRRMTVKNYTNMIIETRHQASKFATPKYQASFRSAWSPALIPRERFFRFRQTNTRIDPHWRHPQLRHNLCAASRNAIFYFHLNVQLRDAGLDPYTGQQTHGVASRTWQVKCLNRANESRLAMDVGWKHSISCLSADHGVLLSGGLHEGIYTLKALDVSAETPHVTGTVNTSGNGGVNHIYTFLQRRSGLPQSAICANDCFIRILDTATNQLTQNFKFPSPVNCSAMSPDGRLRILVSDDNWPIVSDAETGEILARLPDHKDHGFACAWSPDGFTMATGHQDGIVQIWDARQMRASIHALPAEQGGVRSLAFSPLGTGYPVLVMAEPIDIVSIVDAKSFHTKQDLQFFGELSGFTMPPDDRSLFIGNGDQKYGGIMEFERTGDGRSCDDYHLIQKQRPQRRECFDIDGPTEFDLVHMSMGGPSEANRRLMERELQKRERESWERSLYDWLPDDEMDHDDRIQLSRSQRRKKGIGTGSLYL